MTERIASHQTIEPSPIGGAQVSDGRVGALLRHVHVRAMPIGRRTARRSMWAAKVVALFFSSTERRQSKRDVTLRPDHAVVPVVLSSASSVGCAVRPGRVQSSCISLHSLGQRRPVACVSSRLSNQYTTQRESAMIRRKLLLGTACLLWLCTATVMAAISEQIVEADVDLKKGGSSLETPDAIKTMSGKRPEDNIPVIEIRGEGKPMTAAQIRALEEETAGKPLDIKVKHTWRPSNCPRAAKRKDFVTFHYKAFTEDGKKYDQTYGRGPIRMQLGVGLTMPGLDKGLRGMCDTELRKITIPFRLSRKKKSKVWKYILNDEHWLVFDIEMLTVEPWSLELQFSFMDLNNDTHLTTNELAKFAEKMRKEFGRTWPNEDIDNVIAGKYFVKYFDANNDNKIDLKEYKAVMQRDQATMSSTPKSRKPQGRNRDPGIGWILDFNNDGVVTLQEMDSAAEVFEGAPAIKPLMKDEL